MGFAGVKLASLKRGPDKHDSSIELLSSVSSQNVDISSCFPETRDSQAFLAKSSDTTASIMELLLCDSKENPTPTSPASIKGTSQGIEHLSFSKIDIFPETQICSKEVAGSKSKTELAAVESDKPTKGNHTTNNQQKPPLCDSSTDTDWKFAVDTIPMAEENIVKKGPTTARESRADAESGTEMTGANQAHDKIKTKRQAETGPNWLIPVPTSSQHTGKEMSAQNGPMRSGLNQPTPISTSSKHADKDTCTNVEVENQPKPSQSCKGMKAKMNQVPLGDKLESCPVHQDSTDNKRKCKTKSQAGTGPNQLTQVPSASKQTDKKIRKDVKPDQPPKPVQLGKEIKIAESPVQTGKKTDSRTLQDVRDDKLTQSQVLESSKFEGKTDKKINKELSSGDKTCTKLIPSDSDERCPTEHAEKCSKAIPVNPNLQKELASLKTAATERNPSSKTSQNATDVASSSRADAAHNATSTGNIDNSHVTVPKQHNSQSQVSSTRTSTAPVPTSSAKNDGPKAEPQAAKTSTKPDIPDEDLLDLILTASEDSPSAHPYSPEDWGVGGPYSPKQKTGSKLPKRAAKDPGEPSCDMESFTYYCTGENYLHVIGRQGRNLQFLHEVFGVRVVIVHGDSRYKSICVTGTKTQLLEARSYMDNGVLGRMVVSDLDKLLQPLSPQNKW